MNFNGTFMKNFKFIRGVIIKSKVQNSKKQVKTKICKETGPGPKGNGFWIIQTHQERWIDPASPNLDLMVQTQGNMRLRCTRARGIDRLVYKQKPREKTTQTLTVSLSNMRRERESANDSSSPVTFHLSPTWWPAVVPPRRSFKLLRF
jgi:hypothetical protein